jgi:GntR family transcriptional regulator/MocR family aminotransferase
MRGHRASLDWIELRRDAAAPLQRQIGDQMKAAIADGRLPEGARLPSSRTLAADLAVARGTATAVYDRLIGEGLLSVRDRSAVYVAEGLGPVPGREPRAEKSPPFRAMRLAIESDDELPPPHAAFLPGVPALDVFPALAWSRLLATHSRNMATDIAGEGTYVGGYPKLRAALAGHLRSARGLSCTPEQVVVTNSARAALTAACRLLTRPGDACLVEDPGYPIAHRIIVGCGLKAMPIPVDGDGMKVDVDLPAASLAYVTPTHQLPLGVSLSADRCRMLVAWARRHSAWVIEDDYDSELRYAGRPTVSLQRLDPYERVIHIGTFAKTMFPSLRAGFLVAPEDIARDLAIVVHLGGQEPALHIQAALADFISHGHYAVHIRRARAIYRRRQALLVNALNRHLEGIVSLSPPLGGINLLLVLPPDIPAIKVQTLAAREGIHARAVSYYALKAEPPNALHLGFAPLADRLIEPAAARLAGIVRSLRSGPSRSRRPGPVRRSGHPVS